MKKTFVLLILMQGIWISMHAQTHYGDGAGTSGANHSYFGYYAGNASTNSSGYNAFFGAYCGRHTVTGFSNAAIGSFAFSNNTEGFYNVAVGAQALFNNSVGNFSVAIGRQALFNSDKYGDNSANGYRALYSSILAHWNDATGALALQNFTEGIHNTATGFQSLSSIQIGDYNIATGAFAMEAVQGGERNSAYGFRASSTTSGSLNSAFGYQALFSESQNSCTGSYNTSFGAYSGFAPNAGCDLNNSTAIGYLATFSASNQVRIGNSTVTSIGGQVSWSTLSDGRFKKDIQKDVSGLDFINQINPVSYILDKDAVDRFLGIQEGVRIAPTIREANQYQIGFIAQEVEAIVNKSGYVFSGVETPQNKNDPYTIRYAEFVVPLVKAVQELLVISDDQQQEVVKLKEMLQQDKVSMSTVATRSLAASFQNDHDSFSSSTKIQIELPEITTQANLILYNLAGSQLKNIGVQERGKAELRISDTGLRPGMYLYALIADGKVVSTNQIVLE